MTKICTNCGHKKSEHLQYYVQGELYFCCQHPNDSIRGICDCVDFREKIDEHRIPSPNEKKDKQGE